MSTGLVPNRAASCCFKKLSMVFTFGSEAICWAVSVVELDGAVPLTLTVLPGAGTG